MTSTAELPDIVRSIMAETTRVPLQSLTLDSKLFELGVDSLAFLSIGAQMEARFGLELTAESIMRLMNQDTVGDLVQVLGACLADHQGSAPA